MKETIGKEKHTFGEAVNLVKINPHDAIFFHLSNPLRYDQDMMGKCLIIGEDNDFKFAHASSMEEVLWVESFFKLP